MKKVVLSGMIGNGLEWYDYALYGQIAWLLAKLFFPAGDAFVQMLATYGVFAAGFIVRPIGAVFFGWIGDTYGRKRAMVIAILMMAIPTGCIGLLPGYAEIGILAPILLTVIRLMQGLSLGGEFSGSIAYIVEHGPQNRRGLTGLASLASLMLGFLLGLFAVQGVTALFGQAAFEEWAWRIPFILGVAIGLVGFYIRSHCTESPIFIAAKDAGHISKTPVKQVFREHMGEMLQGFAIYISVTMPFYLTTIYFINFDKVHLGISAADVTRFSVYNMLLVLAAMPITALLSDKFGRKKVMSAAAFLMMLTALPLFSLMTPEQPSHMVMLAQLGFALMLGLYIGPVAAVLVELFPTSIRFTGMAITYNVSAALFGGTAPMVAEWLFRETGQASSIAYYVILANLLTLIAFYFYKERFNETLR